MFRKQDFKKVDLLGSGKKNTKIYKAEHIPTGKYYAIKEVEAKTLDKLNEYKVNINYINSCMMENSLLVNHFQYLCDFNVFSNLML